MLLSQQKRIFQDVRILRLGIWRDERTDGYCVSVSKYGMHTKNFEQEYKIIINNLFFFVETRNFRPVKEKKNDFSIL